MHWLRLFAIVAAACTVSHSVAQTAASRPSETPTSAAVSPEALSVQTGAARSFAASRQSNVQKILDATAAGNDGWNKMQELCDDFGHRLSGSAALERAIDWAVDRMKRDGQENCRKEEVMVPHWVRNDESCEMVEPRRKSLAMLGLGGSVPTPPEGITAEVIVVSGIEELSEVGDKAKSKIVLFNVPMAAPDGKGGGGGYGAAVRYRGMGARWASEYGGVAALVRSVTTRSLRSPHTGAMGYYEAKTRVPTAAISTEDADMIARLYARGVAVRVTLKMACETRPDAKSHNVIAEIVGSSQPEQVVVIGGHFDSWDVGQGAHDDGGGCVAAMEALNVIRKLGLKPNRTIRVVLWTNEENGLAGARAYAKRHADAMPNHFAAIESDSGTFQPMGFGVDCEDPARLAIAAGQLRELVKLLEPLGPMHVDPGSSAADVGPMKPLGVPVMGLDVDMTRYFDYHHTHADTLDKIDPRDLSKTISAMAAMAYMLAEAPGKLGDEWPAK
ncbi:MAG: M20/M25/M40 family metallo-hydrolase [Phycisphaerae bacterium]